MSVPNAFQQKAHNVFANSKTICDAVKQNESEVERYQILFFGICYLRIIQALFGEIPMEIGQLIRKIQAVEGLQK